MQKYLMQCLAPYYYRGNFLKTKVEGLFGHDVISRFEWELWTGCWVFKGLGCRVPSDLELDLLDAVVGSPVCYWEIKSFPCLKYMNSFAAMFKKHKVPG